MAYRKIGDLSKEWSKGRAPDPAPLTEASGLVWFMEYLQGGSIRKIAMNAHRNQATVKERMTKAASRLIDDAHASALRELVPLAAKVLKRSLEGELNKVGQPNTDLAEKVMKSMYVFDSPILKEAATPEEQGEIESLELTIGKLTAKRTQTPAQVENHFKPKELSEGETKDIITVEGEVEPNGDSHETDVRTKS